MPDPLEPPPDAVRELQPDGALFVWQPDSRVIVVKATGTFSRPHSERIAEFIEAAAARATPLRLFFDLSGVAHYTREGREIGTKFTQEHRSDVETAHFLLASKIVALGVAIFKHAVTSLPVSTYSSRTSFLRSLAAALDKRPAAARDP